MRAPQKQVKLEWVYWLRMAGGSLAGASQMVWQSSEEANEQRALFDKVAGYPVYGEWIWRDSITWIAAVILALSLEQSIKAIALYRVGKYAKTHDLKDLWESLEEQDRNGIECELQRVKQRTHTTKLGEGNVKGGADAIVRVHAKTFEMARYYQEDRPGQPPAELTHNIDLWQLALAAFLYGQRHLPVPAGYAEDIRAMIGVPPRRTSLIYSTRHTKSGSRQGD